MKYSRIDVVLMKVLKAVSVVVAAALSVWVWVRIVIAIIGG